MNQPSVKEFKPGDSINQILLLTKKELRSRANGAPYGHLEFRDKSSPIAGKIWDDAKSILETFEAGDFIKVRARVNSYKNRLELAISSTQPVASKQIDLADFLPHAHRDIELMTEQLKELLEEVKDAHLGKLIQAFLKDTSLMNSLQKAPASLNHHQAYIGGLLEHTLLVVKLSRLAASEYPTLNQDLLLTGAFLHDIGKAREYVVKHHLDKSIEGRLIGHITLGTEMITEKIGTIKGFPQPLAWQLKHLILSHHGKMELGAPVMPMLLEAVVLHYMDNLDASVTVRLTALEESSETKDDWAEIWDDGGKRRIYKSQSGIPKA